MFWVYLSHFSYVKYLCMSARKPDANWFPCRLDEEEPYGGKKAGNRRELEDE